MKFQIYFNRIQPYRASATQTKQFGKVCFASTQHSLEGIVFQCKTFLWTWPRAFHRVSLTQPLSRCVLQSEILIRRRLTPTLSSIHANEPHSEAERGGREIAWKLKALSNNKKIKKFCRLSFPPKTRNKRFNRADALNDVRRTPEGRRRLVASGGWRPSCSTPQQQRDSRSAWLSPFELTLKIRFDASWGEARVRENCSHESAHGRMFANGRQTSEIK